MAAKKLSTLMRSNRIKGKFTRPEGAGNFDNMDDFNIVKAISINEGSIQNTPTLPKHITHKEYVDTLTTNHPHQDVKTTASPSFANLTVDTTIHAGGQTAYPFEFDAGNNQVVSRFRSTRAGGATVLIDAAGGSGADALLGFQNSGSSEWTIGFDDSDADKFKISHSSIIATNTALTIDESLNVGIGTTTPAELLDINGDAIRIRTAQTPASASATGTAGMICWDANYIYVCTATDTWKRTAISTW